GIPELRAAVCAKLKRDNGLDYTPAEALVSCGAKHTLYNLVTALLNPGDEMLVPSPFWVSYPEQARLLGAVPVAVDTREATGFDLEPDGLRAAVTPRTKLIVLNSPNNPTGAVFSRRALEAIAQWAAVEALSGPQDEVAKMAGEFDRRRRLIIGGLNALPGVSCVMPKGAFYAFANVAGLFGRTWVQGDTRATLKGSIDVTGFL